MANIVLPRVDILDSIKESANILVEQDGSIKRFAVADLDVGGNNFLSVDKNGSNIGEPNPINADTLGGKSESELSVANSDKLGGKSPEHYATSEGLFAVHNEIKNRLYHVVKTSGRGDTVSVKLYRGSDEGRLTMFIFGDNNGPAIYGAVSINIYRTIHSDPNYLSCKSILHIVDDAGN